MNSTFVNCLSCVFEVIIYKTKTCHFYSVLALFKVLWDQYCVSNPVVFSYTPNSHLLKPPFLGGISFCFKVFWMILISIVWLYAYASLFLHLSCFYSQGCWNMILWRGFQYSASDNTSESISACEPHDSWPIECSASRPCLNTDNSSEGSTWADNKCISTKEQWCNIFLICFILRCKRISAGSWGQSVQWESFLNIAHLAVQFCSKL